MFCGSFGVYCAYLLPPKTGVTRQLFYMQLRRVLCAVGARKYATVFRIRLCQRSVKCFIIANKVKSQRSLKLQQQAEQ